MTALDGLNQRFGTGTLKVAAMDMQQEWAMRRDAKTPNYTTQWAELPVAR